MNLQISYTSDAGVVAPTAYVILGAVKYTERVVSTRVGDVGEQVKEYSIELELSVTGSVFVDKAAKDAFYKPIGSIGTKGIYNPSGSDMLVQALDLLKAKLTEEGYSYTEVA